VASDSHLEGRALILGVHQAGSTPIPADRLTPAAQLLPDLARAVDPVVVVEHLEDLDSELGVADRRADGCRLLAA
jgi:hypothetical protein